MSTVDRGHEDGGSRGGVTYVDHLTVAALATLVLVVRPRQRVRYFEASRGGRAIARFLTAVRLLPPLEPVASSVSDARGPGGASPFLGAYLAARRVCGRYVSEWIAHDPLIDTAGRRFDTALVKLHFDRLAEIEVRRECLRVALVRWLSLPAMADQIPSPPLLLLRRASWTSALREHVLGEGLLFMTYREVPDLGRAVAAVGRRARLVAARVARVGVRGNGRGGAEGSVLRPPSRGAIGLQFGHRTLKPGALRRSEFFWLEAPSPASRRLILFGVPADAADEATCAGLRSSPMNVEVATGTPPTSWRGLLGLSLSLVVGPAIANLARGRLSSPHIMRHLVSLLRDYLRWRAFFLSRGIGVTIAPFATDATVGQVLALRDLGGVSTGYQHSISNIVGPSALLSPGPDVAFVSAEHFALLWNGVPAPPTEIVPTGFIYDAAIKVALRDAHWRVARGHLLARGVRYVITFFDENSLDGWHSAYTNADASLDYEFLLRWLLEDPTLGLVLKPKKSSNLLERVAPAAQLIADGLRTGRCLILASETLVGSTYPAEAAMMSDVVIGKLTGSTAAFEAWLCGRPTVLVDTEGFRDHPFWRSGDGTFVYPDWPAVRRAIESHRRDPLASPSFGDWSPVADEVDPFRDGRASSRMREYVFELAEALDRGASRAQALEQASARHRERWGLTAATPWVIRR